MPTAAPAKISRCPAGMAFQVLGDSTSITALLTRPPTAPAPRRDTAPLDCFADSDRFSSACRRTNRWSQCGHWPSLPTNFGSTRSPRPHAGQRKRIVSIEPALLDCTPLELSAAPVSCSNLLSSGGDISITSSGSSAIDMIDSSRGESCGDALTFRQFVRRSGIRFG